MSAENQDQPLINPTPVPPASAPLETEVEEIAKNYAAQIEKCVSNDGHINITEQDIAAYIRSAISTALSPLRRELEETRGQVSIKEQQLSESHESIQLAANAVAFLQREIAEDSKKLDQAYEMQTGLLLLLNKHGIKPDSAALCNAADEARALQRKIVEQAKRIEKLSTKISMADKLQKLTFDNQVRWAEEADSLQQRLDKTEAELRKIVALTPVPSVCDDPNCWPCLMWAIANAALASTEKLTALEGEQA